MIHPLRHTYFIFSNFKNASYVCRGHIIMSCNICTNLIFGPSCFIKHPNSNSHFGVYLVDIPMPFVCRVASLTRYIRRNYYDIDVWRWFVAEKLSDIYIYTYIYIYAKHTHCPSNINIISSQYKLTNVESDIN